LRQTGLLCTMSRRCTSRKAAATKVTIGNRTDVVPRHAEINEMTAKAIIRKLEGRP